MKHRKQGRKFSFKSSQQKAMLKSLARALFLKERIKTTESKAKELRRLAERFLTKAKNDNLAARRYLARYFSKTLVKKIVKDLAPRYKERPGGYTRIIKLEPRKSDGAKMSIIELLQ